MDVPAKLRDRNPQPQHILEMADEPVNEVVCSSVAFVNQVVAHGHPLHLGVVVRQLREVRVVFPQLAGRRAYVGEKHSWMSHVQVAHRRRHHDNIAGAETAG